jgi:hypothetical protein
MKEIQIDRSARQRENALSLKPEIPQSRSDVKLERVSHSLKQCFENRVIDKGIQIT